MARLIRRQSMERLELYDLDKLIPNYQLSPSIPPPHKYHHHRRSSMNPTFERYQFLCNMTRNKTDPIYAATPMFTTIPKSLQEKPRRQLLGSYIRSKNVKPLPTIPPKTPEPKSAGIVVNVEEKENDNDNVEKEDEEENNDNENQFSSSSSSSSDEEEKHDDHDDNNNKGVVEQIFNQDKKN